MGVTTPDLPATVTLSASFRDAMLDGVRARHGEDVLAHVLASAAIPPAAFAQPDARLTRAQYGALYRAVAATLDDEMLGLWSRPIRTGTLKYLMLSLLDAPTVLVALNRFVRFWNLLLDDYRLHLSTNNDLVRVALVERAAGTLVTPLGHALMMKLAHGIACWLLGRDVGLHQATFGFAAPRDATDYTRLFPGTVRFDAMTTSVDFAYADCAATFRREKHELWAFLKRAPEDWTFSAVHHTSFAARARAHIAQHLAQPMTIQDLAQALHTSVRTLNRRLAGEGTHFQLVKDGLRREVAVHRLAHANTSVAMLAFELGFADATSFCRAFKQWTGSSPSNYRKVSRQVD